MSARSAKTRRLHTRFAARSVAFSANDYLVRHVERILLEHLDVVRLGPTTVLDLGCGPGRSHTALKKRYPSASHTLLDVSLATLHMAHSRWPWQRLPRVCADFATLPFNANSIDLVFSNLSLSAAQDLPKILKGLRAVIRPGGLIVFSMLGPDTLIELRQALSTPGKHPSPSPFMDMHDVGDVLVATHFADVVMDCERLTVQYESVPKLLSEIAALSVLGPCFHNRPWRTHMQRLVEHLTRRYPNQSGQISMTLEVIFAHAWIPQPRGSQRVQFGLP